jgi:anaerobic magnesium-protoporphyrin IX monomethyl ester cyclase
MRVLLVQPRYTYPRDVPLIVEMPLGLCYLAAVLRQRGHDVQILDCLAEGYTRAQTDADRVTYGISEEEIIQRVKDFRPQMVGCSAMLTLQYGNVERLCRLVKAIDREIVVVVGGMHPTVKPEEVLANRDVDFLLRGEADYTLAELVDALEHHGDYTAIDGIGYRSRHGAQIRDKRHFIENLDALPPPARDLLKVENYFQAGLAHGFVLKNKRNVNLITSRGCPARCVFCTVHLMWGRKFRARSPENVLAELEHLKQAYQVKHVQFEDDNLTYDIPRAKAIFRGMIDRRLNLAWTTPNGVALWRMDEETLRLMKQAGCYCTKFAVESGNQRVLSEVIQKPQRLDAIIPLIRYARKIGIKVGSFFVVGLPGETREEMQDSFRFPHRVKLDWAEYSIATPHHGTVLRKLCEEKGYLRPHSDADLYARKGLIETPEFDPAWLEQTVLAENRRYVRFLLFHQPLTLLSQGWEVFRRNPAFTMRYLWKMLQGGRPRLTSTPPAAPAPGIPRRPEFLRNDRARERRTQK